MPLKQDLNYLQLVEESKMTTRDFCYWIDKRNFNQ